MKEENPNLKLLIISTICTLGTILIWSGIDNDQSSSMGYLFMLIFLWIIVIIISGLIIWVDKVKVKSWNLLALIFCTPIPYIIFFSIISEEPVIGSREFNKNNHRVKEVEYRDRKEYLTSLDVVTEEDPFPKSENYRLDSIVYSDGKKSEYFK